MLESSAEMDGLSSSSQSSGNSSFDNDTWEEAGQNWFGEDESKNPAQLADSPVLHTMYHFNGLEYTIPLRPISRGSVIGPDEAGPSRYRNYFGKIRCTARKSVLCPAYYQRLRHVAQPKGSHDIYSPYRRNTLEQARKMAHGSVLFVMESFSSDY